MKNKPNVHNTRGFKQTAITASCAVLLGCSNGVLSSDGETDLTGEELFFSDIPVVLSATRLSQPITETPAAITVIDRELIEASGAINIADLFRLVPGFQVGFYSGSKPTLTYHGNTDRFARDMQVLIDGRSIYDPAFGGVTWLDQELDIADIQHIEVIRGPNAASYGSNSYAGVINIVTIHPGQQQGTRLKTVVGKFGHRQVSAKHAGSVGSLDYRFVTKYDQDDGFDTRVSDSSDTHWLSFRGDYQVDENDALQFQMGMSKGRREDGFVADSIQPPRNTRDTHHFQQLRWTRNLPKNGELSIRAYHNYQLVDDDFFNLREGVIAANTYQLGYGFESHRYDIELQHTLGLGDKMRLVWGIGARQDQASGIWTFNTHDWITRDQLRGFGNLEWRLSDKLIMNAGGMYEKFEEKSGLFSPRIALNYKLSPNHAFRAISTRAYRMPTFWEDFSDLNAIETPPGAAGLGLPSIQFYKNIANVEPERIDAFELGYLINLPKYDFQIDLKTYEEKFTNLIAEIADKTSVPCAIGACTFYYDNDGHYEIRGWELDLNWNPTSNSLVKFSYSRAKGKGMQQKKSPIVDAGDFRNLAGRTPEQTFSILGNYKFNNGFSITGAFYYVDPIDWGGDGDDVLHAHRSDLYLSKAFDSGDMDGNIGLLIQRYSDEYWDFYSSPEFNKENKWADRVFLQLTLNWH